MQKKLQLVLITSLTVLSICLLSGCSSKPSASVTPSEKPPVTSEGTTEREEDTESNSTEVISTETQSESVSQTELPSETEVPSESENLSETEIPSESETEIELESTESHTHSYTESITKEATCTEKGERTFTCECGDSYTKSTKATGHDYVTDETTKVAATCTEEGKKADKICSICGDVVAGKSIAKKDHDYGKYVYNNDATQEKDGTKSRTCKDCGKVSTKTATGTKLPFDPHTLDAVKSLNDIPVVGTIKDNDSNLHYEIRLKIEAGKYKKVRYKASNGKEYCLWNVRLKDDRNKAESGKSNYYWFVAPPVEEEFSNGYMFSNLFSDSAKHADANLVLIGPRISGSLNECMLDRDKKIPLGERTINTKKCPVELYKIVEKSDMVYVWVESTNCGQEGIGTCGSFDCKGTCLRSKTLAEFDELSRSKLGYECAWGENGRINWNGKLLVCFYYLKYE